MKNDNTDGMYLDLLANCRDEEVFIHTMMLWHFSKQTGTEFWLRLADELDFDPIRDVKTFRDLKKFPDVSDKLRLTRAEALMPRGITQDTPVIFESGGTTGRPKLFIFYEAWVDRMGYFQAEPYLGRRGNILAAIPTGPHMFGAFTRKQANYIGGLCFTLDFDPRWVRAEIGKGHAEGAERYAAHIIEQIKGIIETQQVDYLSVTPPLLRLMVQDAGISEKLKSTLKGVIVGGAEVNLDEIQLIAETILPDCTFQALYGSTSALGGGRSPFITAKTKQIVYESVSPFVTYSIVDLKTFEEVETGERGKLIVSHLSPYAFYPNIVERDTAIKLLPRPHMFGSCIADVITDKIINGKDMIEGVY